MVNAARGPARQAAHRQLTAGEASCRENLGLGRLDWLDWSEIVISVHPLTDSKD